MLVMNFFSHFSNAAARRCANQASQNNRNLQDTSGSNFQKVQGTMSEDEALAKAIYESMLENEQHRIAVSGATAASTSNNDRNKNCAIS
jgi:hypothetical protein